MRSLGLSRNRCLVAGGAGFIGSNLVRALLARGMQVDCVDDLSTGRESDIVDLKRDPAFRFIQLDVSNAEDCTRFLRRHYSQVYHLACPTGVPNIELLGEEMLLASSAGTYNLLKIARTSGARFLFTSTAEAYGDPQVFPQAETYAGNVDPVGPRSAYEEAKRFGEALTCYYGRKYGVDARIVRIFNTYGPRMSPEDQRVIPQMIGSLINGQPVLIYGDGSQTRTFLHVDDLIDGLLTVMERGSNGEAYNIGGSRQLTIKQLFEAVKKATGLSGRAVFQKHFISDHRGRWPDTSKVEALGWSQKVSLADGLREMYAEFVSSKDERRSDEVTLVASFAMNGRSGRPQARV
ncbi:MAG: NAD-dependent epimerase/dehydratase family protein [Alphaproteobacteria bacterium]|nr:NAD-dependent epimerase/dehydratase family protein [Alphaproteobacteria bacterium]MBU0803936.1 NAD-dependent epimerase/dehydratase family protein [Alphaproteobacteria bacterium]MBU0872767.1 NAD-dependent epimerase/dehydratase family protein [Alphaproteobacteria bacterium]MBU1402863.1 NAD-dependent epimerase/dehydratase family protein [Alphaproteobacteria bacterium]MBU1593505.1 NAD-dependent epimerase/dehydratase family protein [Alphaproteobacteria bacterium]